jgi:hypothetical protein
MIGQQIIVLLYIKINFLFFFLFFFLFYILFSLSLFFYLDYNDMAYAR